MITTMCFNRPLQYRHTAMFWNWHMPEEIFDLSAVVMIVISSQYAYIRHISTF